MKHFSKQEIDYITKNIGGKSLTTIARDLGRSREGVRKQALALGVWESKETKKSVKSSGHKVAATTRASGQETNRDPNRDSDTLCRLIDLRNLLHDRLFNEGVSDSNLSKVSNEYRTTLGDIHELDEKEAPKESKLEKLFEKLGADED